MAVAIETSCVQGPLTVKRHHMTKCRHLIALSVFAVGVVYIAAYYLTVDGMFSPGVAGAQECAPYYELLGYSLDRTFMPTLFHPIQRIDVRIRDRFWVVYDGQPAEE